MKLKRLVLIKDELNYMNCIEDHIHCLIILKPSQSLSKIINGIKGEPSNWINEEKLTHEHFQWQEGYGAFSVSPSMIEKTRLYIKNQEIHHKKKDYQKELEILQLKHR